MRLLWARVGVPYSPGDRPADRARRRSARWSIACWRCRRARGCCCWRRWCATARASTARNSRSCNAKASPAPASTASSTRSTRCRRSTKIKHDIEVVVDRIVVRDGIAAAAGRQFRDRARSWPTGWSTLEERTMPRARTAASALVFSSRFACPGVGLHHRGDRAAAVQLQLAARGLPGLRRVGHRELASTPTWWCRTSGSAWAGRDRAVGPARRAVLHQMLQSLARHSSVRPTPPWHDLPQRCATVLHGTGEVPVGFTYMDGVRATR